MNQFDKIVQRLEHDWPGYQVWYVPRAVGGGPSWHARRWDADTGDVIHADSADELGRLLEQEGRPD
jgi:hypothetical protein